MRYRITFPRLVALVPRSSGCALVEDPFIPLQKHKCPDNSFANGKLRRPAKPPYSGPVEETKRAVAHPAALTARVPDLRLDSQVLADPSNRIIHFAVLVGAEVEDVHLALSLIEGGHDR